MSRAPQSQPQISTTLPGRFSPRQWDLLAITCLLVATLPWWLALKCPFILVDDPYYTKQSDVFSGLTGHTFVTAFTHTLGGFWLPLTSLSLKLDATLFGTGPLGFHATNIVLHVANAILLYFFLKLATDMPGRSLLVAALFAMHPLRVESVAWVTERKDVLSGLFGLLTLLAYVYYAKKAPPKNRRGWYMLTCLFYLLGLLAKPVLVTFPFVLLLVDIWPLQRQKQVSWPRLLLEKLPLALCAAAVSAITVLIVAHSGQLTTTEQLPLSMRFGNAAISYLLYLRDTFYFQDLALFYPGLHALPGGQLVGGILLLVAVTSAALILCKRLPRCGIPALIGWLWFLGMLVPNIGIVQSGLQSRADRFTYFPSIGLFIALVWVWPERWFITNKAKFYAAFLASGCVVVLAVYTTLRILLWTDPLALYVSAVAHTEKNGWMECFVGRALDEQGDAADAEAWYRLSIGDMPNLRECRYFYGSLLGRQQRYDEALQQFSVGLMLAPDDPVLRNAYNATAQKIADQRRATTGTAPATP